MHWKHKTSLKIFIYLTEKKKKERAYPLVHSPIAYGFQPGQIQEPGTQGRSPAQVAGIQFLESGTKY